MQDIAAWLNVPPAGLLVFGEDHRPCKLTTVVRGYNMPKVCGAGEGLSAYMSVHAVLCRMVCGVLRHASRRMAQVFAGI